MSSALEIMLFISAAILLGLSMFDKVRKYKFYNLIVSILLILYFVFGIWFIFFRNSHSDQDKKDIIETVKTSDSTINNKIGTSTKALESISDKNRDSIIKSFPIVPPINTEEAERLSEF